MKVLNISVLIIILLCSISYADVNDKTGQSGAQFLKIQPSTKAAALGDTGTAIDGSIEALFNNPAGLGTLDHMQAGLNYSKYIEGLNYSSAAFAMPIQNIGTFGLGYTGLSYGDIPIVTFDSSGSLESKNSTTANDLAIILSYARKLGSIFSLGANAKFINQTLENESANAFAFDIGTMAAFMDQKLKAGIVLQNIGNNLTFMEKEYALPMNLKMGCSYNVLNLLKHKGSLMLDLIKSSDDNIKINPGVEYGFANILFLRLGYQINNDLSNLTAGGGINIPFNNKFARIDYAFTAYEYFQTIHRIGLVIGFSSQSST